MRSFRSSVYKDIKLFLSGAGLLSLLLPFLLLPALRWGVTDLAGQSYVRPFPIAVRDQDGTLMSRSLISQLEQIDLFSQVRVLEDGVTDAQAVAEGAAAVATIPRDFFYDLYTMEDCPVTVTLNSAMGTESALFGSIVRAVMGIIRSDQASALGAYTLAYGDLTPELAQIMYAEAAEHLFRDALGRQQVFDEAAAAADPAGSLQRRLAACVLAVTTMFFALSAAKTLPEETALGVLPRFRALGGRAAAFLLSKFCAAFVLTLPVLAVTAALFPGADVALLLGLDLMLLWAAFGLFAALALWTGDGAAAQRWGNLLLLLSLAAGGTIWPRDLLPDWVARLGRLTPPWYAALALDARAQGASLLRTASLLWPLALLGAAGLAAAFPALGRRPGGPAPRPKAGGVPSADAADAAPRAGFLRRTGALALFKLRASSGGPAGLAALLAVAVLCGFTAAAARSGGTDTLHLALCDLDGSALSRELAEDVAGEEGLSCTVCELAAARRDLLSGDIEGLLIIGPGYGEDLAQGGNGVVRYEAAGTSLSAQGAREIAAGKISAQRSRLRAADQAEALLGRSLTAAESAALQENIRQLEQSMPPLYRLLQAEGTPLAALFTPAPMSFAALAALFTLLTAAGWFGAAGGRVSERRMCAMPRGRLLSYGSDCLALSGLGLLVMTAVLLPAGGALSSLPAAVPYALCAAALALVLTRPAALAGRVDALAPFLALLLCLLGGCFLDLSSLSPAMEAASLLSPAGLAIRAGQGSPAAAMALLAEGAALFFLGMPRKHKV